MNCDHCEKEIRTPYDYLLQQCWRCRDGFEVCMDCQPHIKLMPNERYHCSYCREGKERPKPAQTEMPLNFKTFAKCQGCNGTTDRTIGCICNKCSRIIIICQDCVSSSGYKCYDCRMKEKANEENKTT